MKIKCDILSYAFDDSLQRCVCVCVCIYTNVHVHIYVKSVHMQKTMSFYIVSQFTETQYILSNS